MLTLIEAAAMLTLIDRLRHEVQQIHWALSAVRNDATDGQNWKCMIDNIVHDREKATAEIARLRGVLEKVEWSSSSLDSTGARMGFDEVDGVRRPCCPCCGRWKPTGKFYGPEGHSDNCSLAAALNPPKEAGE